jgi:hypothetical protein
LAGAAGTVNGVGLSDKALGGVRSKLKVHSLSLWAMQGSRLAVTILVYRSAKAQLPMAAPVCFGIARFLELAAGWADSLQPACGVGLGILRVLEGPRFRRDPSLLSTGREAEGVSGGSQSGSTLWRTALPRALMR